MVKMVIFKGIGRKGNEGGHICHMESNDIDGHPMI